MIHGCAGAKFAYTQTGGEGTRRRFAVIPKQPLESIGKISLPLSCQQEEEDPWKNCWLSTAGLSRPGADHLRRKAARGGRQF